MDTRTKWITWGLISLAAILAGIAAGRPIMIPPIPIEQPECPPPATPPAPPTPKPDPLNAIVRIGRAGVGCSLTIIGPRRADGRYWGLSAAHCCDKIGERWQAKFRDGRTTGLQVVSMDKQNDYAWMLTDVSTEVFPFALLATSDPAPGEHVWHSGFGVDRPGNREDGTVTSGRDQRGQIEYRLSVSSGDSGGGIMMNSNGEALSPVCCGTNPGTVGRVWGSSPVLARRGQVVSTNLDEWTPIPLPRQQPGAIPAPMPRQMKPPEQE